jgi:CheY-like chemotaxis protein
MFKLFLIEDNEGDILLISEALEDLHVPLQVSFAKDGQEAVSFFNSCINGGLDLLPDLVLLDINLPRKNGQEVLQFIKSSTDLKQVPVIMLSTSSSHQDILESYQNQANSFISKPVGAEGYQDIFQKIEDFWFSLAQLPSKI